jgi:23S rRNA pseudouridine1911/1915/1917 synthase
MRNLWTLGAEGMNVLYEDNHVLCVEKPANMPVNEDDSHDEDLLSLCKAWLKEKYHKPGNVYLGLVHRLDRPVGGVMVFAKTSKAASRLSDSIRKREVQKEYLAVLDGIPKQKKALLEDYLVKDPKKNMVRVTDKAHGKYCSLEYEVLMEKNGRALVHIVLHTGRSHQIRVQFASRNLPLVHDQRYHPHPSKGQIGLYACRLTFPHPTKKEPVTVEHLPPARDPWKDFGGYHV